MKDEYFQERFSRKIFKVLEVITKGKKTKFLCLSSLGFFKTINPKKVKRLATIKEKHEFDSLIKRRFGRNVTQTKQEEIHNYL